MLRLQVTFTPNKSTSQKVTELTVNNLGSRIITLLGNSRKRTAVIITPGNEWAISDET